MKKIVMVFTILLSVLCCTNLFAQTAPDTLWLKKYGFCGMNGPDVNGVAQTPDGGFLVLGSTTVRGQGGSDFLLIRTDQTGDTLWTRTYGGTGNDIAFTFNSMCMTSDGGCVITGLTTSFGGGQSLPYCLRVNPQGDTLWTRVLSSFVDGNYVGARPIGSGFMLLGSYNNDEFLERVDSLGNPLWNVALGIGGYATGLDRSTDGKFLVSGRIGYPMSAAKVDTNGTVLWSSGYRGGAAYGVTACENGGGVFVGDGYGFFTGDKFDAAGTHIWSRTYSGYYGMSYCALHLQDNSLVLGGYVPAVVPSLFKVSSSGDVIWSSAYPYLSPASMEAGIVTSDHGFAFAGATAQSGTTEGFLMKLGSDQSNVPPCPPTPLPFIDNFDSPELDSCWNWIREDAGRWSLNERPGWMRLVGNGNIQWPGGNTSNILLRTVPDGDLVVETRVDGHSNANSALIVYRDDDNFIDVIHNEAAQRHIRTHSETNGQPTYVDYDINAEPIYLRIEKIGTRYAVKVSSDGLQWGTVTVWDRSLAVNGSLQVGMISSSDPANTPSDYDYFRVDSIETTMRALVMDGSGDYVDCGSADSVRLVNTFSIDVLAKFTSTTAPLQTMVARDGYSENSKWIFAYNDESYAYTDNRLVLLVCNRAQQPSCYWPCSEIWTPVIGPWYHLSVVVSNRVCTFYVDGQFLGSASLPVDIPSISTPLTIGWAEGPGSYFNGELDNVRIWNRALSQEQIQSIAGCEFDNAPGLLASYHFDQQDGNTVYDSGPVGYNGQLVGNAITWPSNTPVSDSCLFPDLVLLSPNGGEQWRVFSSDTVIWSGMGVTAPIKIELNRHYPQNTWEVLNASTPNDGSEAFFISDPLSDSCRIRITAVGDVYKDSSAANFSIVSSQGYLALALQSQPLTPVIAWPVGSHECPETVTTTYKLKNFGSENIVVFAPALVSGAHFNVSHDCPPFLALSPGQMSTCDVTLSYNPQAEGSHRDTLRMQTDAINAIGGYLRIPLSGSQTRTPASPQVVITTQGQDARLSWEPVTLSGGDCPITVTEYIVFFSEESEGPFWYHGFTTDTTYVHGRVITHADGMFYHVVASTAPLSLLLDLPPSGQNPPISEEQVLEMLRERRIAYEHVVN